MSITNEVKKRISPYMKTRGFSLSGRNYYYISNDIGFCLALDAPSGLLYVTAYIMPLYVPCECIYYTYGTRINNLRGNGLPPLLKSSDSQVIDKWCEALCHYIEKTVIPFFIQIETPQKLVKYVEQVRLPSKKILHIPEVFSEQLKMYTYLYLQDNERVLTSAQHYRRLLTECTFLTDSGRQKYLDEISTVESVVQGGEREVLHFLCTISAKTKSLLL